MLRLSKLTDYGTVIMTHMARMPDRTWSATELAAAIRLSVPTVSKILKILVHGGLLCSSRGARGGYLLAHPPAGISLARIISVMEGPVAMTECNVTTGLCAQESGCAIRRNWQRINQVIVAALDQVTLEEMAHPALPSAPPRESRSLGRRRTDLALPIADGGHR